MHKIQESERCEALDLNEKGRASWQCCWMKRIHTFETLKTAESSSWT